MCLPWLRWLHRFGRPRGGTLPAPIARDRITNYLIGHREVGLDEAPVLEHFRGIATEAEMVQAMRDADAVLPTVGAPGAVHAPQLISCLCPTFGQQWHPWQHLLEESVEAFLRQTDVHSELLILNDHPAQELVFDHPRVRVVNQPQRLTTRWVRSTMRLVSLASGSLLAPWEDDDISLPHRLRAVAGAALGERGAQLQPAAATGSWIATAYIAQDHAMGVGHNLSLFRKRAWRTVGGYPVVTGSQDAEMDELLTSHARVRCRVEEEPLPVPAWYYLYRWGASPCHLSGQPDMQGLYDSVGAAPAAVGRFQLRPHWREDYPAQVATAQSRWRLESSWPSARDDRHGRQTRPRRDGCDTTFKRGADYLSGVGRVEDWGCGTAYFKRFVPAGCYCGIDHDPSAACDQVADLASYSSTNRQRLRLLRHVAGTTLSQQRSVLHNALVSFRRRMVLVVYTPFVRATAEYHRVEGPTASALMPEIHFCRGDLVRELRGVSFRLEENIPTDSPFGREHVFYICKDGPA